MNWQFYDQLRVLVDRIEQQDRAGEVDRAALISAIYRLRHSAGLPGEALLNTGLPAATSPFQDRSEVMRSTKP